MFRRLGSVLYPSFPLFFTRHSERGKRVGLARSEESSSPLPRHSERGKCEGMRGAKNLVNRRGSLPTNDYRSKGY